MQQQPLASVVVAFCLVAAAGLGASAVESTELAGDGGRVELAEAGQRRISPEDAGFAVTFSDVWDVDLATREEVTPGADRYWLFAWYPRVGEMEYGCQISSVDSEQTLEEFVARDLSSFAANDPGRPVITWVELPSGRALRVDDSGPAADEYSHVTEYYLQRDGTTFILLCTGSSYPDDYWLSIAESFEFLPKPVLLEGGRIAVPGVSAALTFGDTWTVEVVTPESHPWLFGQDGRPALEAGKPLIVGRAPDRGERCLVLDFDAVADEVPEGVTGLGRVEEIVDRRHPETKLYEGQAPPSGRGWQGLVSGTERDGTVFESFSFERADSWLVLDCQSSGPPSGDWRSIAESFDYVLSSSGGSGRGPAVFSSPIEASAAGVAIDVPDGWYAFDLGHPDLETRLGEMDQVTQEFLRRGAAQANRASLAESGIDMAVMAWPPADGPTWLYRDQCVLMISDSKFASTDEVAAANEQWWDSVGMDYELVEFPAGTALVTQTGSGAENLMSTFGFVFGDRSYQLVCSVAQEAVADSAAETHERWRSIAASFRILDSVD